MKNFGKMIALILILALTIPMSAFADDNTQYADTLYELGLFKGTDNGYELEKTFTREEAATVLVRLLGEEKNVALKTYPTLFTDVESDRWSFPYVMYCYENEITRGTGEDTFSPVQEISAEEFVTLVLRLLGYTDAEPKTALEDCIYLNLLNSEIAKELELSSSFTRNDMVYIVYRSLMTKTASGDILADILAEKAVISEEEAEEFDVYGSADNIDELLDKLLN